VAAEVSSCGEGSGGGGRKHRSNKIFNSEGEKPLEEIVREIDGLREQIGTMKDTITGLKKGAADKSERIAELETEVGELETQVSVKNQQIEDLQKELRTYKLQHKKLEKELRNRLAAFVRSTGVRNAAQEKKGKQVLGHVIKVGVVKAGGVTLMKSMMVKTATRASIVSMRSCLVFQT